MNRQTVLISIMAITLALVLSCNGKTLPPTPTTPLTSADVCGEAVSKACNGCSPDMELLRVKLNTYSPLVVSEVKNCINISLLGNVKSKSLLDAKINACLENSKVLEPEIVKMIKDTFTSATVREELFQVWLDCYKEFMKKKPAVVVMDQPNNDELVYCTETRKIKASNFYDIDILLRQLDTPLNIIQVATHLAWQNEQQVIGADPALVIVHASAFYKETKAMDGNTKLIAFLNSLKTTNIKVLVYTRGLPDQAPDDVRIRWERIKATVGGNVELFVMPKGHDSCFSDPEVGMPFKQKIKEMLSL